MELRFLTAIVDQYSDDLNKDFCCLNQKQTINEMMTNPTRAIFTPEVIFTSPDECAPPTTLIRPIRAPAMRKFSFPATLHSSSLLTSESNAIGRTTRRLSNVSDRVTDRVRKLSTAMGWHHSPSKVLLISQARFLITLYIRFKLKRSGTLNQQKKKIGLQKMQRSLLIGADVKDVFIALKEAATVLETMHMKIYTNVSRQLSSSPSNLESPEDTAVLLTSFGRILFKSGTEITWGKVISLFSVAAGLSIDLVRSNHEDHIPTLIEGFLGVIEDELIPFLCENHGWISLHNKLQNKKKPSTEWSLVLFLLIIFIFFFLLNNYLIGF